MTSYYVYYRVDPARLSDLREKIENLFDSIESQTGVRGRWMRRRDDPATYMEVYEGVKDARALEALLGRECERLGLAGRRLEIFIPA